METKRTTEPPRITGRFRTRGDRKKEIRRKAERGRDRARASLLRQRKKRQRKVRRNREKIKKKKRQRERSRNPVAYSMLPSIAKEKIKRVAFGSTVRPMPLYSNALSYKPRIYGPGFKRLGKQTGQETA